MKFLGPFSSGIAAGGAGIATNNATTTIVVKGSIKGIYVDYLDSPPNTTDVTIATSGVIHPAVTLLTLTNKNADGWFYPRVVSQSGLGVNVDYAATFPIYEPAPINDTVKVTIAQANNDDSVNIWILYE